MRALLRVGCQGLGGAVDGAAEAGASAAAEAATLQGAFERLATLCIFFRGEGVFARFQHLSICFISGNFTELREISGTSRNSDKIL